MNAAQLIRKARFEVDAIRASGASSGLWTTEECLDALNTAMERGARLLRESLVKTLRSDGEEVDLVEEVYDPASLAIVAGTSEYTLPPDLVRIVSIIPTTTGYEGTQFRPANAFQRAYLDSKLISATDQSPDQNQLFMYAQSGLGTFRIVPTPVISLDVELVYCYRPPRVLLSDAGTVNLVNGSTAVTATDSTWLTEGMRLPIELVVGDDVDLNIVYPKVASLVSDVALTLSRAYRGATVTESAYTLAMVPTFPVEHHQWLAQYTAALMLRKVNIETSDSAMKALEMQLRAEIQYELDVFQTQESVVTEPFELP